MLNEDAVGNRTGADEQSEVSQIQNGEILTVEQIRKIFEGYIGGACGLANIFCDLADED